MRVKFCETYINGAEPDHIPCVLEILSISIYDDTQEICFVSENRTLFVSVTPLKGEYEQSYLLNSALEKGYVDLTKYGYFVAKDDDEDNDDEDENE